MFSSSRPVRLRRSFARPRKRCLTRFSGDVSVGGDNTDPNISSMYGYFNVAFNPFNYGFLQWGFQTTPQELAGAGAGIAPKQIGLPMGKVLGGSHSINACAYVQGHASDFDRIAEETDDRSWKFHNLSYLRRQLENELDLHKTGMEQVGADQFVKTAEEVLGLPYNDNPLDGDQYGIGAAFWTAKQTDAGGVRMTSYDVFVEPVLQKKFDFQGKVDVVTYSVVEKLLFDSEDPTKVIGVSTFNTRSNLPFEFYASKEVIVSAGTYSSPKILMLSGIGPQEHLDSLGIETRIPLEGVGKNLRDHYAVGTFWQLADLPSASPLLFQQPSFNVFGPETDGPPSYQMELSGTFGSITPLKQDSVGTVELQSTDPMASPLINPNVLSTEDDIQRIVDGLKTILIPYFSSLVEQNLITEGSFSLSQTDDELWNFVVNNIGTNHHPTGTCKIGSSDDPMAVVDKDFKVYGTKNLRVVDGSIFPLTPSGNTNASIMTAAMLASRKLKREYRSSMYHRDDEDEEDDEDEDESSSSD